MKININNEEKINALIDKVQKNCKTRLINYSFIVDYVDDIEKRLLSLHVPKKEWKNMIFSVNHHLQQFARCYNGIPMGTNFNLARSSSYWFVTGVDSIKCSGKQIYFANESEYQKYFTF